MIEEFQPLNLTLNDGEFHLVEVKDESPIDQDLKMDPEAERRQELDAIMQEAKDLGYKEGWEKAQSEIRELKAELNSWLSLIEKPVQLIDERLMQSMIQTIIWLANQCIGIELSQNPEKLKIIYATLKAEWEELSSPSVLAMHPEDIYWLQANMPKVEMKSMQKYIIPDPQLNRGDFYLKGESSELDGRLKTRLQTLFSSVMSLNNTED